MRRVVGILLAAFSVALSSCAGTMDQVYLDDVAYPVHFVLDDGSAVYGTVTPKEQYRSIVLVRPDGVTCSALYRRQPRYVVPIRCLDGSTIQLSGKTTVARDYAELRLPDNRTAHYVPGFQSAVTPQPINQSSSLSDNLSSNTNLNPSTTTPSGYCGNSNYYGAISCVTGLPKTQYVSGYLRKDGTYVRPYYRSKR